MGWEASAINLVPCSRPQPEPSVASVESSCCPTQRLGLTLPQARPASGLLGSLPPPPSTPQQKSGGLAGPPSCLPIAALLFWSQRAPGASPARGICPNGTEEGAPSPPSPPLRPILLPLRRGSREGLVGPDRPSGARERTSGPVGGAEDCEGPGSPRLPLPLRPSSRRTGGAGPPSRFPEPPRLPTGRAASGCRRKATDPPRPACGATSRLSTAAAGGALGSCPRALTTGQLAALVTPPKGRRGLRRPGVPVAGGASGAETPFFGTDGQAESARFTKATGTVRRAEKWRSGPTADLTRLAQASLQTAS